MRDSRFIDESGAAVSVSQMSTQDIHDCLADGFDLTDISDCPGLTRQEVEKNVRERLRIELIIRQQQGCEE
jgi:hypothetical protein